MHNAYSKNNVTTPASSVTKRNFSSTIKSKRFKNMQ